MAAAFVPNISTCPSPSVSVPSFRALLSLVPSKPSVANSSRYNFVTERNATSADFTSVFLSSPSSFRFQAGRRVPAWGSSMGISAHWIAPDTASEGEATTAAPETALETFLRLYEGTFDNERQMLESEGKVAEFSKKEHIKVSLPAFGEHVFFIRELARLPDNVPRFRIRIGRIIEESNRIESHHFEFEDDTPFREVLGVKELLALLEPYTPENTKYVSHGVTCFQPIDGQDAFELTLREGPVCKATKSFDDREQVVCFDVAGTLVQDGFTVVAKSWKEGGEFLYGDKTYILNRRT